MLANIERAYFARISILPFHGIFSRSCVIWSYATSICITHGSANILPDLGAVMVLVGRQSDETIFSALPELVLNVDMLIFTFKFPFGLTAFEKYSLLYNRRFLGLGKENRKSLQFVHDGSPLCINSTADFCIW